MKQIVYSIVFVLLATQVFSQEVNETTARIVAENFFLENYGKKTSVEQVLVKQYKGHESLFFCNMDKGGWVAVPANRNLNPVVAHSDEGKVVLGEGPDVFWDWMEQYEFVVDVAIREKWENEKKYQKWENLISYNTENILKSYVDHTVLISSKWSQTTNNQGYCLGYNRLMPELSSCTCGKASAGCVAVAIGQIMNYWGFSNGSYSAFDWWNMPDGLYNLNNPNYDTESIAISYLLKRIGDLVDMEYGCSSRANTKDADEAFTHFGYKDDLDYKRKIWHTYNSWVDILKTEILAERPVLYRYIGAHTFVCDGYESSNDNFHFNLGWGNYQNLHSCWVDFEDIDILENCSNYDNLSNHSCWVGIQPDLSTHINISNHTIASSALLPFATNMTFQAKSSVVVAGENNSVNIVDSSSCRLIAGDSIVLKPGFHANKGSSLFCKIYKKNTLKNYNILGNEFQMFKYSDVNEFIDSLTDSVNNQITVYPNPVCDALTISFKPNESKGKVMIKIFNMKGILLFEQITNSSYVKIDVSQYISGKYIVYIKKGEKQYHKIIIKQ